MTKLRTQFNISIQATNEYLCGKSWIRKVQFQLGTEVHFIFVDDEFEDFKIKNPDLHLCLVLRSLEHYKDAKDFLAWCTQLGLDASDSVAREHHMGLRNSYAAIEKHLGDINSFVSDYDLELNAGAAQALRKADQRSQNK